MIKYFYNIFAVICVFSTNVGHAHATTAIGSASASIIQSIELSEDQAMSFGQIALNNNQSDTVTLSPDGSITSITSNLVSGALVQNAIFSTNGAPSTPISVTFQNGFLTGAGSSMQIQNFVHDAGETPTLSPAGTLIFQVGAELQVNENQATGSYNGTYQVTVNYQ